MTESFDKWKDKLLFWGMTAFIMGGVSWAAWITIETTSHIDSKEAAEIVHTSAPYLKDRELIRSQVESAAETGKDMRRVIEKNTEAINALTVEIAKMQD